jgi:hypothetical protein
VRLITYTYWGPKYKNGTAIPPLPPYLFMLWCLPSNVREHTHRDKGGVINGVSCPLNEEGRVQDVWSLWPLCFVRCALRLLAIALQPLQYEIRVVCSNKKRIYWTRWRWNLCGRQCFLNCVQMEVVAVGSNNGAQAGETSRRIAPTSAGWNTTTSGHSFRRPCTRGFQPAFTEIS